MAGVLQRQRAASKVLTSLKYVGMCVSVKLGTVCVNVCVAVTRVPDRPQMGAQAGSSAFWL